MTTPKIILIFGIELFCIHLRHYQESAFHDIYMWSLLLLLICHGINIFELAYAYWCLQWIMFKEEAGIDERMKKLDQIRPSDHAVSDSETSVKNVENSPVQMWPSPNMTPQFNQSRLDGPRLKVKMRDSEFSEIEIKKFHSEPPQRQKLAMTLPIGPISGFQEIASDPQYGRTITTDTPQNIQNDMKINGMNRFSTRSVAVFDGQTLADAPSPTRTATRNFTKEISNFGTGVS
jgi:hypothetical protein